jgi:S-adenosylhomocysteine hydrolase
LILFWVFLAVDAEAMAAPDVEDLYRVNANEKTVIVTRKMVFRSSAEAISSPYRFALPSCLIKSIVCEGHAVVPAFIHRHTHIDVSLGPELIQELLDKDISFDLELPQALIQDGVQSNLAEYRFTFQHVRSIKATLELGSPFVRTDFQASFSPSSVDFERGIITIHDGMTPQIGMVVINLGCTFIRASSIVTSESAGRLLDDSMRTLSKVSKETGKPLAGKRIVVLLHFLNDLLPFAVALLRRGADPSKTLFLYKDYPYPSKAVVKSSLRHWGFQVADFEVTSNTKVELERALSLFFAGSDDPILVLEDGGYIVPPLLSAPSLAAHKSRVLGAVEQTTNGRWRVEAASGNARLPFPYLNVAGCEIKRTYEPGFVAEAGVRNICSLLKGDASLKGRQVLVIGGGGAIGSAVVQYLIANDASVYLLENSPVREFIASASFGSITTGRTLRDILTEVERDRGSHSRALILIGATGSLSVKRDDLDLLPDGCILVSVSSRQVEFDLAGFETKCGAAPVDYRPGGKSQGFTYTLRTGNSVKQIHVLGWGYPINFVADESVDNALIDPIMCLLFLSLLEIAEPRYLPGGRGDHGANTTGQPWLISALNNVYTDFVDWLAEKTRMFD